jgi:hypothetical protein
MSKSDWINTWKGVPSHLRKYLRHRSTCLGVLKRNECDCGLLQALAAAEASEQKKSQAAEREHYISQLVVHVAEATEQNSFLREALDAAVKDREYFIAHAKRLESMVPDAVCEECGHLFAASEIVAESPEAWGHPCHAQTTRPVGACESYRVPIVQSKEANR